MKTTYIYTLSDPRTGYIRYVGKTNNISQRKKAHLNRARKHQSHKKSWIESLRKKGLKPVMEVIDEVPINDWAYWEMYWISQCKTWGFNLVNHTYGGEGSTFGNQTSFKKGDVPWNKGESPSTQTRKFISDSLKGRATKPVSEIECYDLLKNYVNTFDNMTRAAEATGCSVSKISLVCNNKRSQTKGYIFKFKI